MLPIEVPPLTIRVMTPGDAAAVRAARVHPDNERYNGWRPATVLEVVEHALAQDPATIGVEPGTVQLVIEEHGQFVGDFGVQTPDALPVVELGLEIVPEAKRRGIATRATRLLLDALFAAEIHRVVARVDPRNEPSVRLFRRLGFREEGRLRSCYWDEKYQEWTDELVFGLLRTEWTAAIDG
jgi:aminoglycoside 6'-N-acetyltransferase